MRHRPSRPPACASVDAEAPVPVLVQNVLHSPGSPLDPATRVFMNARFNHDFSGVRVHADDRAMASAEAINALAYTHRRHIVFGRGQYEPATNRGRHLLAHELTHIVQQNGSADGQPLMLAEASSPLEREAHLASTAIAHGDTFHVAGTGGPQIARQLDPDIEEGAPDEATPTKDAPKAKNSCPVKESGTLSEVSWGETSGIYPGKTHKYSPAKWDAAKTCLLLKARGAVHAVGDRGESVRKGKPADGNRIEQMLKVYHLVENFPALDPEITDSAVKWFYLSSKSDGPKVHPGAKGSTLVKSYGRFYNIGGGDVPEGDVFIHFYKLKAKAKRRQKTVSPESVPSVPESEESDDE